MDYKIEIITSKAGLNLYESSSNSMEFFLTHLEGIRLKQKQIKKILERFPDFDDDNSFKDIYSQLEFNGFITISYLDLSIISREIFVSKRTWEKLFYAKHAYLLIFETIKTFHYHSGEIRRLLSLNLSNELKLEFKEINQVIRGFKKTYNFNSDMSKIRNKVAGHIETNFETYYDTLRLINIKKTGEILKDFVSILSSLQRFSNDLLHGYSKIAAARKENTDKEIRQLINQINEVLRVTNS